MTCQWAQLPCGCSLWLGADTPTGSELRTGATPPMGTRPLGPVLCAAPSGATRASSPSISQHLPNRQGVWTARHADDILCSGCAGHGDGRMDKTHLLSLVTRGNNMSDQSWTQGKKKRSLKTSSLWLAVGWVRGSRSPHSERVLLS